MTCLVPMSEKIFAEYLSAAVAGYANDNIVSGRWPEQDAHARSEESFRDSLPQGLQTPNQYLFEITDIEGGSCVGYLWFAVVEKNNLRSAFVYDLEIKEEHRRQGYAEAAFREMEKQVRELGLQSIGLHVFAYNKGAQALYEKLGYQVSGLNMLKHLQAW